MFPVPSPHSQPPSPPPPSSPSHKPNMPMLYYGLIIIGTAAMVLAIYNLLIIKWCTHRRPRRQPPRFVELTAGSRSFEQSNNNLLSSFKYKKENTVGIERGNEYECAVCLSVFEEGEEVKQLPGCKHSFHADCIDMWLYSHSNCPLCRARVAPPPPLGPHIPAEAVNSSPDNSRDNFLGATVNAQFIPLV